MNNFVHNALRVEEKDGLFFARRFPDAVTGQLAAHALYEAMGRSSASVQLRLYRRGKVTLTLQRFSASLLPKKGQLNFAERYGRPLDLSESLDIDVDGMLFHNPLTSGVTHITEGEEITIHLPNHHEVGFTLEGSFEPIPFHQETLLCLGDSIIQGVGVHHSSEGLCSQLGQILGMNVLNQGLAGSLLNPKLVVPLASQVDYILLGYGTNDWSIREDKEEFRKDAELLFANLRSLYPHQPIIVLTPLYRGDHASVRPFGRFEEVGEILNDRAVTYENVTLIDGVTLSLRDQFDDGFLHPNSTFITHLAQALGDRFPLRI